MNARRILLLIPLALLLVAPSPASAATLTSPCPPDSGESSLFRASDGTVYLTWSGPSDREGERALRLATLAPGTSSWSEARTIVSTPRLMENWADFATLIVATDGALWAQWFQRRADDQDGHGYDGWFARSTDGGATWSPAARLGHEFVSMIPLAAGRVLAVWLENTGTARGHGHDVSPTHAAASPYAPAMQLRARLLGADGSLQQDWLVDPDVCNCCQTSLVPLDGDGALVAYRGHTRDELRDHRVARFDGKTWGSPQSLHADNWKIAACPVNGPAADTHGQTVAIAWFTAAEGAARVQVKFSEDQGVRFGPPRGVDAGRPIGRVDVVMLADGSAVVTWLEAATEQHRAGLFARRLYPDGSRSAPRLLAPTSAVRASGFPRLAKRDDLGKSLIVSWTDATLADPANPKSPAATQVRVLEFSAEAWTPDTP